jgi:hypothetical protein
MRFPKFMKDLENFCAENAPRFHPSTQSEIEQLVDRALLAPQWSLVTFDFSAGGLRADPATVTLSITRDKLIGDILRVAAHRFTTLTRDECVAKFKTVAAAAFPDGAQEAETCHDKRLGLEQREGQIVHAGKQLLQLTSPSSPLKVNADDSFRATIQRRLSALPDALFEVDPSKCTVAGSLVSGILSPGEKRELTLKIVNADGHAIITNELTPTGVVNTGTAAFDVRLVHNGGGEYRAEFTLPNNVCSDSPILSVELAVKIFGAHVAKSPLRLTVQRNRVTTPVYTYRTGASATFNNPTGIVVDHNNTQFVVDQGSYTILKISPDGVVTPFAGQSDVAGHLDGDGHNARFNSPTGITIHGDTLYVADTGNHRIRKITALGRVTTVAGGVAGFRDGPSAEAQFNFPTGVAADDSNVYVADRCNHRIRAINLSIDQVHTVAGDGSVGYRASDSGKSSAFHFPAGIAAHDGVLYVADEGNHVIRWVSKGGGNFAASRATFDRPVGVTVRADGAIIVADQGSNRISIIPCYDELIVALAGSDRQSKKDGVGASAGFNIPAGIAVSADGVVYVADTGNHLVRKI